MWGGSASDRKDGGPATSSSRNGIVPHEEESLFIGGHHGPRRGMLGHPRHEFYRTIEVFGSGGKEGSGPPGQRPTVLWKGDTMRKRRFEPFCSPVVPHVPIRQRLAYRRCTSVDANDIDPNGSMSSYGYPRRRKMSLLQSLRQQNKHLADSGLDVNRQRTDSESSPPQRPSPPNSPSKGALGALKSKTKALFGRKESRPLESRRTMHSIHTECSQTDPVINGRSRKSPSTTNDSGRGSQGHLDERVFERILERVEVHHQPRPVKKHSVIARTNSCPNIALPASRGAPLCNAESDDDILFADKNSSPVNSIDFQIERRLAKRALEIEHKLRLSANGHAHFNYAAHRQSNAVANGDVGPRRVSNVREADEDSVSLQSRPFLPTEERKMTPADSERASTSQSFRRDLEDDLSRGSVALTEDLHDFDDNASMLLLDHFLPLSRSSVSLHVASGGLSSSASSSSLDLAATSESWPDRTNSDTASATTATSAQTDLSLLNCEDKLAEYLSTLHVGDDDQEGMNFIAKHFFEYQSFVNLPHKAVQLHKTPPAQAGTDPSMGWAPKNMHKAGKNQPAPSARANRIHRDPRPNGTKHGRAGKHEHREWGDRHGELKDEKVAPHKDAWTKFLSNEDPGTRTIFECDFEDRVLQSEEETLPERLARKASPTDDLEFQMAYNANKCSTTECELLTILTYAPLVQFVTATVKKAKALPFNNAPFARIMLFEGRRLLEQKQTTINPSLGRTDSTSSPKPSTSSSSSVSSGSGGDASFSESFLFHVIPENLDRSHIVIEMFDHAPSGSPMAVGHCVIGRLSSGTGHAHWLQMIRKPQLPVCMWHRIAAAS